MRECRRTRVRFPAAPLRTGWSEQQSSGQFLFSSTSHQHVSVKLTLWRRFVVATVGRQHLRTGAVPAEWLSPYQPSKLAMRQLKDTVGMSRGRYGLPVGYQSDSPKSRLLRSHNMTRSGRGTLTSDSSAQDCVGSARQIHSRWAHTYPNPGGSLQVRIVRSNTERAGLQAKKTRRVAAGRKCKC